MVSDAERRADLLATSLADASDALIEVNAVLSARSEEAESARRELEAERTRAHETELALAAERARSEDLVHAVRTLEGQLEVMAGSKSWRLTQPLRSVAGAARARRRRT
jgi:hypothetical protein